MSSTTTGEDVSAYLWVTFILYMCSVMSKCFQCCWVSLHFLSLSLCSSSADTGGMIYFFYVFVWMQNTLFKEISFLWFPPGNISGVFFTSLQPCSICHFRPLCLAFNPRFHHTPSPFLNGKLLRNNVCVPTYMRVHPLPFHSVMYVRFLCFNGHPGGYRGN